MLRRRALRHEYYVYYNDHIMAPGERVVTFRPDDDVYVAMLALKARDGIPVSEQIRRALRAFVVSKGVMKSERKRAGTRKRP